MGAGIVPWPVIEEIAKSDTACFAIEDGEARKIQTFSEETGRVYTLYPTAGAPTMLVSGVPMHRIKGIDPLEDTRRKLQTIAPIAGRVLDTATGLGYTAIGAARRRSRWRRRTRGRESCSRRSASNAGSATASRSCANWRTPRSSASFTIRRVTAAGGRLFHYIGDPESHSGARVTRGVLRRLAEAGFRDLRRRPEAFGVSASR